MRSKRAVAAALAGALVIGSGAAGAGAGEPDSDGSTGTNSSSAGADAQSEGQYQEFGDARGFLNILPPGQTATLDQAGFAQANEANTAGDETGFPPYFADQRKMYNDLVFNSPGLAEDQLTDFFKDASFGVPPDDIGRTYQPGGRDDVTVIRDESFNVPHIFGETREGTMFAEGYTTAEDRILYMDVLRNTGRGRLSEFVGFSDELIGQDIAVLESAPYTEADLQAQVDEQRDSGAEGAAAIEDLDAYTAGVNAFIEEARQDPSILPFEYTLLGKTPAPWKTTDAVAIGALIGGIFGRGGGREVSNLCGLDAMTETLGSEDVARTVFDDFKFANDPDAPTTSRRKAPYNTDLGQVDDSAIPDLDCSSLVGVGADDAQAGQPVPAAGSAADQAGGAALRASDVPDSIIDFLDRLDTAEPVAASNAILVDGEHTDTGHPIAVFGPQIGYSVPELMVEHDVHGPGIDARGVGFLGIDLWLQIGRGRDYAWSATSSGADNIDQFVLRLCDPAGGEPTIESMGYEHDGQCKEIETFDHVVATTDGLISGDPITLTWTIQRSPDHGPINQRGTLKDGTPIAIADHRSTYFGEITSGVGFRNVNDPRFMEEGFEAFRRAMGEGIDFTFNWFYVDADTIGYQQSCKCPLRAEGVDPALPAFGTGEWDWQGFLASDDQPFDSNPDAGYITSWNNKQAPEFAASDQQWSFGPTHRVELLNSRLEDGIESGEPFDRAAVVDVMEDAATVDLRGQEVLPVVLDLMGLTPPEGMDERLAAMREELETWADTGAHRKARGPDDQVYEQATPPAIMDAWWAPLTDAVLAERSGDAFRALDLDVNEQDTTETDQAEENAEYHDAPGDDHQGSSFANGSYSQVLNDLGKVAGNQLDGAWERDYCGGGDRDACRQALWDSLQDTIPILEAEFGSAEVADWQRTVADDEIRYGSLVVGLPPMNWVNRPTFQQVVQLETEGRAALRTSETEEDGGGGSNAGLIIFIVVIVVVAGGLVVVFVQARRRAAP